MGGQDLVDEWDKLVIALRNLPEMTEDEKLLQRLDFAYGNLACTTNHRPTRDSFWEICRKPPYNWSREKFDEWAADKEWVK